jgi:geranylgeranyl reductase family protein
MALLCIRGTTQLCPPLILRTGVTAHIAQGSPSLTGVAKKVLIIGAGPSGTACALTLHRLGHHVTIVDKAIFPRDKCCGDGLTTHALRILEKLEFSPAMVPDWKQTHKVLVRSPDGRTLDMDLPQGQGIFAAVAPRRQLDHALVEQCTELGISVHQGLSFRTVVRNDTDGVSIDIEGLGVVDADYVVAADGMWSPVRKSLGLSTPGYLGEWHAFRQYLSNVDGPAAENLYVWFDDDVLPGYVWSFPLPNNRVNFGFCMLRNDNTSMQFMKKTWNDLFERPHVRAALGNHFVAQDRHSAWPIPARIDDAVRATGRIIFVGDAVCATDIMTGEGIAQALETGIVAAHAIAHNETPSDVRHYYSRTLDSTLLADHRMSKFLGKLLSSPKTTRRVLAIVNSTTWTQRYFVRWMFEDEPRAALFTPRRWHRRFLRRPGAYRNIFQ